MLAPKRCRFKPCWQRRGRWSNPTAVAALGASRARMPRSAARGNSSAGSLPGEVCSLRFTSRAEVELPVSADRRVTGATQVVMPRPTVSTPRNERISSKPGPSGGVPWRAHGAAWCSEAQRRGNAEQRRADGARADTTFSQRLGEASARVIADRLQRLPTERRRSREPAGSGSGAPERGVSCGLLAGEERRRAWRVRAPPCRGAVFRGAGMAQSGSPERAGARL